MIHDSSALLGAFTGELSLHSKGMPDAVAWQKEIKGIFKGIFKGDLARNEAGFVHCVLLS